MSLSAHMQGVSSMRSIRVCLFGLAHPHSSMHLRTLDLLPEVEGIFLCPDEGESVPEEIRNASPKICGVLSGLRSLARCREAQVVWLLVRNSRARQAALRLAKAGKHLYCEKPVGVCAEDPHDILDAAVRHGVRAAVCYPWRANPVAQEIRRLIAAGAIGRVLQVEMRMVTSQVRLRDPRHWLFKKADSGGGILSWLGCHWFDLLRYILQDEITAVAGTVQTLSGEAIDVEDTACLTLRLASGAIGSFAAGYLLPRSVPGYSGATYDTGLRIWGEKGRITWDPIFGNSAFTLESVAEEHQHAPVQEFRFTLPQCEAYNGIAGLEHARRFLAAVQNGGEHLGNLSDAVRVHRIIEAAYAASASRRETPVRVDPV